MALTSSLHTMSTSSNSFLLPKTDLIITDTQLIEILLHDQNLEHKIQIVNRWCKNSRRNRFSSILDVSQRHDVLLALVNTLQQTTNIEYQFNCLTLLSELQTNIHHYDQRIYLPAIIQCFGSTSTDVQKLTKQILIKQIHATQDIPTFLYLFTQDGLKSSNNRIRIKSIQYLNDLLTTTHQYENLSPIFELLLQYLADQTFRSIHFDILNRSIQHLRRILGVDLLTTYLDTYELNLQRTYQIFIPQQDDQTQIPIIDTDLEDEDETPRASIRTNNSFHDDSLTIKQSAERTEFYSIVDLMQSKWLIIDDTDRLNYLDRFKIACENYLQLIRQQYLTNNNDTQFHQILYTFLTTILDLLAYLTSTSFQLDLSLRIKLILLTCLGWLIKHAQVNYCKRNYKTILMIFKNILINGQANNRQLAKLSVSLILLLSNFVQPKLILNELIDEHFQTYNYRVQLEILAILTAILLKFRQYKYENLLTLSNHLYPMLISNRRELRHGALECFTVICSYFNNYQPINCVQTENDNLSIKTIFSSIENLSQDASNALHFRLQRNLLPILTDEGNITPGLVCDSITSNDPDAKFILLIPTPTVTPQPTQIIEPLMPTTSDKSSQPVELNSTSNSNNNNKSSEHTPRNREVIPLKTTDIEHDLQRINTTIHHQIPISPTIASTSGPVFDLTVTGNNNYRTGLITEKNSSDDWARKLSTINHHSIKESILNNQHQDNNHHNNIVIPRRSSIQQASKLTTDLVLLNNSSSETDKNPPKRHLDNDSVDSAIESRSLSINTPEDGVFENESKQEKKSVRSVHSSSTRRRIDRLFSTGSDIESTSARTITPENSNESGVYSQQSGREIEIDLIQTPLSRDQLFSTRPRLARSGSKSKLDRSQLPPTDPSLSTRQIHEHTSYSANTQRITTTSTYVEIIGKGYVDEKIPSKPFLTENIDDKPLIVNKPRAKIIKGSVINGPLATTHLNVNTEDTSTNLDDAQDIGVVGKAVYIPVRTRHDSDVSKMQNSMILNKRIDSYEILTDDYDYDSDSKENEHLFVDMSQSLSASFRLRVQQKTQEKIEQKERRRQDREIYRQQNPSQLNNDNSYDNDLPTSSASTSRYSSQPDLSSAGNDLPPTPRRPMDSSFTTILPNVPLQHRLRVYKNSMARSQTFNNRRDLSTTDQNRLIFNRPLSEDRVTDQLRNPEGVYREAMESVTNDDWERKCSGMSLIQRLIAQHPDIITQNLHQIVLVLIQEVKNLRSQVARFALSTFCDMFKHLNRNMDIELDLTIKAIMQKSAESNEFFRTDAEKCLQTMIENVTLTKALQALIAGGASHRSPLVRKTAAKYIYTVCEKLGPNKILSGTRDITERVLQVGASFATDGPAEIRWYGKKIYHMLMPFDELDQLMKHYLNPNAYSNMCEVIDNIRTKGGVGEIPSDSARNNTRRTLSSDKLSSTATLTNHFSSLRKMNSVDQNEQIRMLTKQMRSSDFRERLNGIEEFQKLCELETNTAIQSIVQIFDGFNECLADMNSKVLLKALNTMHQLVPILADALSCVMNTVLPIIAHNIASRNREISQIALDIIDAAIEYIDSGYLLQPLCTLSQNSNLRIRPEIISKLATLVPRVCQRKPKQVEIHLLPTYWKLLTLLRGQNTTNLVFSAGGSNSLNNAIHILTTALYTELGSVLLDKASSSSMVTPKNLQLLRELCTNIDAV